MPAKLGLMRIQKTGGPIVNQRVAAQSPLSILRCLASSLETVFLAFFDSAIPS